ILRDRLFGTASMDEIASREKAGDSPGLIVNTTLYNNGRRFAGTVLPTDAFDYDFFSDLERSLTKRGLVMEDAPYIQARWKLLRPMTPVELHADPCPVKLAGLPT